VISYIEQCIEQANQKAINRVHEVKKWRLLEKEFSIDGGELTPTLKVKRRFVYKKYEQQIEDLY
jgi:long-chain-fatty-acid--CoA ligase ACSBG